MRIRTVAAGVVLLASILACGGSTSGDFSSDPFSENFMDMTAPWTEMGLPSGGTVIYSDDTTLSMNHSGGTPESLASDYSASIEANGWTMEYDLSSDGTYNKTYKQGSETLVLSVLDSAGDTIVALTKLDF